MMKKIRSFFTKNYSHKEFLTAVIAGLGYGGWAFFANMGHGIHAGIMAGLVQGIYAFFSTLSVTYIAHWAFHKYDCGIRGILAGFFSSFLLMLLIPTIVHNLIMTPNILKTILPGLIWGSLYLFSYVIVLEKKNRGIKKAQ